MILAVVDLDGTVDPIYNDVFSQIHLDINYVVGERERLTLFFDRFTD